MGVFRQYHGLYLLPFAVLEDPHFTLSFLDLLFFCVLAVPTSCASRHLMSRSRFSGLTLSAMGPCGPLLDAFPRVMLLRCRGLAQALLRVPMLSPWPD